MSSQMFAGADEKMKAWGKAKDELFNAAKWFSGARDPVENVEAMKALLGAALAYTDAARAVKVAPLPTGTNTCRNIHHPSYFHYPGPDCEQRHPTPCEECVGSRVRAAEESGGRF